MLTVRGIHGAGNPVRVVMDSTLRIPMGARVLGPETDTLVATTQRAPEKKVLALERKGVSVEVFAPDRTGRVPFTPLLRGGSQESFPFVSF